MKIVFFDCDQTIWTSPDKDYISSVNSSLKKLNENILVREEDGKRFALNKSILRTLEYLKMKKIMIGIVSDNEKAMVLKALKLFGISRYFNKKIVNIKLWDGYCPKDKMIIESLSKSPYRNNPLSSVYWLDDKDYSREAKDAGINFVQVRSEMDFTEVIKEIVSINIHHS